MSIPRITEILEGAQPVTTPYSYNVALTNANTQYSQALPTGCKKYSVSIQNGVNTDTFRTAFATGKVATPTAPYNSYTADSEEYEDGLNLSGITLYIASSAGGKVAQIRAWV